MTDPKPVGYYGNVRTDLYGFAARRISRFGRVLNVGCGAGADAGILRQLGTTHLEGVEPTVAARDAALHYDHVFHGPIEVYQPTAAADLVVFADVLEHLVEPAGVLRRAHGWLGEGGHVLISVPNVRHISVLWDLAVRGDWRYADEGILDATHLRFFTMRSFRRLLLESGYDVVIETFNGMNTASRAVGRRIPAAAHFLQSQLFFLAATTS